MAASVRHRSNPKLVAALAAGATAVEAARLAGVSEKTARRRLAEPAFAAEVEAARAEAIERAVARLAAGAALAVSTLIGLLAETCPPTVRCSAARALLDATLKWREQQELVGRVETLEAAIAATAGRTGIGRR